MADRGSGPGWFKGPSQCTATSTVSPGGPALHHGIAPTAYVRALGARPRDGDAVRRSGPMAARVTARQSATCGTVRRPTGPRSGDGPSGTGTGSLRRPGTVAAAGPPPGVRRGLGTAPGRGGGPETLGGRGQSPGSDGGSPPRPTSGHARRTAPPGRRAAGSGGGGDGVVRRRSCRAAGLHPLVASESAAAPRRPA
jgi:hypothetical protein